MSYQQNNAIGLRYYTTEALGKWLEDDKTTEIAINRPDELWFLVNGVWEAEAIEFDYEKCHHLATALASYKNDKIDNTKPLLSCTLFTGERVQVVMPPACTKETISFTIRKPSKTRLTMDNYIQSGFFEDVRKYGEKPEDQLLSLYASGDITEFLKMAVVTKKNIVISGETNSGKTTFMKMLIDFIPEKERLITIEDTNEITFYKHKNFVQMFYPSEAKTSDFLTASTLLKSCLRMNPDRILLAELRSGETFDFINVLSSGHGGSITSDHAGSVDETFNRLALMTMQNDQGVNLPYDVIHSLLRQTIDIVLHIDGAHGKRHITEMYYKGAMRENTKH